MSIYMSYITYYPFRNQIVHQSQKVWKKSLYYSLYRYICICDKAALVTPTIRIHFYGVFFFIDVQ